jgi:sugar phosphate isomerase/epimerase
MPSKISGLAISNIAWQPSENEQIFTLMQQYGFQGLEIAPTKVFANPLETAEDDLKSYKKYCHDRGIRIVAMQSLLFGHPDLTLFDSPEKHEEIIAYLTGILRFGSILGAEIAVFGSPANRRIPETMNPAEAEKIAEDFFYTMGKIAQKFDIYFCIESNPPLYGTNFITDSYQAIEIVKRVNHPNFRFHLDTGALFLNDENIETVMAAGSPYLKHCHVSEKALAIIAQEDPQNSGTKHNAVANALDMSGYNGWVSIEMRAANDPSATNIKNVTTAMEFVKGAYGKQNNN